MRQGEKSDGVYTEVLEKHRLIVDPRREVKNLKVRLQRRLRALAQRYRLRTP